MTRSESIIKASSHYLIKDLPENFDEMEEDEIFAFIKSNVWQPFESFDENFIADCIEDLAIDIQKTYDKGVKDGQMLQKTLDSSL